MRTAQAQSPTKEKLLDAAQQLMLSKGFPATTVEEICEAAGFTKGSFFHGKRGARKGKYGAVVVKVRRTVEELDIVHRLDRRHDLVDHFRSACFRKVGDTFNKLDRHRRLAIRDW